MSQFSGSTFSRYTGFWLIATGLFELALAAVFVVIGLNQPIVEEGFLLTAGILGLTGVALVAVGLRLRLAAGATDRLLREGLAGRATITGLTQTGAYLNNNPRVAMDLQVQLPGRPE